MTLIDTTDSVVMVGAYGRAFVKPIRKLYCNMTITSVSVVVGVNLTKSHFLRPGQNRRLSGSL